MLTFTPYVFYGTEYFLTLVVLFISGIVLLSIARKRGSRTQQKIQRTLSFVISFSVIGWSILQLILGEFQIEKDLPLIFCNLIALLLPIYTYYNKPWLFDVLYFIILAGAIQSVITPALDYSFPYPETIKFWIVHGGLIIFVFYILLIEKKLPRWKGIISSFLFVQAYVLFIMGINYLLDANYLFLKEKPPTASILDLLGDWPYYILVMDVMLIPYFAILYLPILIIKRLSR